MASTSVTETACNGRLAVIVARHFAPENIVGAFRPRRIAAALVESGYSVTVITFVGHPKRILDDADWVAIKDKIRVIRVDQLEPAKLQALSLLSRVGLALFQFQKRFGRVAYWWNLLTGLSADIFSVPAVAEILKAEIANTQAIVVSSSPPHEIHSAVLPASESAEIYWVVDLRDPWDAFPASCDYRISRRWQRTLERKVMANCDTVVSTTYEYSRIVADRFPDKPRSAFVTVTNSFEGHKFSGPKIPGADGLLLTHIGILYHSRDPYAFFRMLARIRLREIADGQTVESRVHVRMIGVDGRELRDVVESLGLADIVTIEPRVSHSEALRAAASADLGLIMPGLGIRTRRGWLPSKVFEYFGGRTPILAIAPEGELTELVREHEGGWVLSREDPERLLALLREIWALKSTNGSVTRPFRSVQKFEASHVFGRFIGLVEARMRREFPLADVDST